MPDLIIQTMQQCTMLGHRVEQTVIGSKGQSYKVSASHGGKNQCDCQAFKFAKGDDRTCKHIEKLMQKICSWHEMYGTRQRWEDRENMICAECGEKTEWIRVAV